MLGNTPVPATSVDTCLPGGFRLNNGASVAGGDGMLLVGGEALAWRPWAAGGGGARRLVNEKGQFEVPGEAFAALGLLWPRPGEFPQLLDVDGLLLGDLARKALASIPRQAAREKMTGFNLAERHC